MPAGETPAANAIFVIDVDGFRIVHMGHFGQDQLDETQLAAIGNEPDFLLIPVGGADMTIDGQTAAQIVDQFYVHYVLPMHFRIPEVTGEPNDNLDTVDEFVDWFPRDALPEISNGISLYNSRIGTYPSLLMMDYHMSLY